MDLFSQICIVIFGASSIWFISRKEKWSRYGFILGLISIPPYLYTTYINDQGGMFVLTLFYCYSYCQGIWNYFIKESKNEFKN